jgi:DNA helicase-2/ATP-dependent DNA helicase PcrA
LNADQLAAATAGSGPHLVIAGPGTGKTSTLIARFLTLVERGAVPSRIFVGTVRGQKSRASG